MSGSLNKVMLIGNLGKDPEIRSMQDGTRVATFSIATSETWKDKNTGERQERTEWHRVVIFNDRLADVVERYVKKGSKVFVEGQLQTRKWTDAQGAEKYTTEVVISRFRGELTLLDSRGASEARGAESFGSTFGGQTNFGAPTGIAGGASQPSGGARDFDDEIPF